MKKMIIMAILATSATAYADTEKKQKAPIAAFSGQGKAISPYPMSPYALSADAYRQVVERIKKEQADSEGKK